MMETNSKAEDLLKELYTDFRSKRNNCKIELDNARSELEVLIKSIEYNKKSLDESSFFSPRSADNNDNENTDELEIKVKVIEKKIEDLEEKYTYYNRYTKELKLLINSENKSSDVKNNKEKDVIYNLNLNYDNTEIRNKLTGISHKLDLCLKIFDNDKERAKSEVRNIRNNLDSIIRELS
jgi:hypothetical protein